MKHVLRIWPQVLIHIITDDFISSNSSGMANTGLILDIAGIIIWPGEQGYICEEVYLKPFSSMRRNTLQSGHSKERGVWGKYKVINCGWA